MEKHQRTCHFGVDALGGASQPLYAGEVHYFRTDPNAWQSILESMHASGFTAVSTIVPWNVHEERAGRYRWSGRLDLERFVETAADAGLMVIAKPGPMCGGELNFGGLPERVLTQSENLAVTARDTPAWFPMPPRMYPLPSQASESYIAEARVWLAEVGRVLGPFQAPEGPLVSVGLDNHLGGLYRTAAFDVDYHPSALAWWAEHSGGLEAPRRWSADDAERCARWVEFKEVYVARAMAWISAALDDGGLPSPARYHNAPPVSPGNVSALRVSGHTDSLAAWDVYQLASGFDHMRELGRYLAGSTSLPFASALGCGAPAFLPPASPSVQCSAAIATLGAGVRAFSISMACERDRWTGAATELADGEDWVRPLLAALNRLSWSELTVDSPVALIESRADSRYGLASSSLGPVTPQLSGLVDIGAGRFAEFGRDSDARELARWQSALRRALDAFEIPFVIVDEAAPLDSLGDYRLIICPTLERVDAGLWAKLATVVSDKTRVILGPGKPTVDAFGAALDDPELSPGMGLLRAESLTDRDALGADLLGAVGELDDNWIAPDSISASCTVHRDPSGAVRAVVLVNTAESETVNLAVPPNTTVRDALTGESWIDVGRGALAIELAARSARLLEVG